MRPSCLCLTPFLFILSALAASGQPPSSPTQAADLYERAVNNLNDGHWFENAITDLTEAVQQEPNNSDYHLALGCAEVDRAGSVAYAAFMTDQLLNDQTQYTKDYDDWRAAQQNPKADDNGQPAPVPPPVGLHFQTKDDLTRLKLTGKQALARVIELGRAAQTEWVQAIRLTKTPQDRAQAENVQGWGLQYELNLLSYTGYAARHIPGAPKQEDAVAAFAAATRDDPTQAAYWEGLGDAESEGEDNQSRVSDCIHAWQAALALKPGNTELLFRLYEVRAKSDPKTAQETLKAVAESDPSNSFLQYSLAALLFKQVHYNDVNDRAAPVPDGQTWTKEQYDQWHAQTIQDLVTKDDSSSEQIASEAVSAIERGNAGTHYSVPEYTPPVPKILWHAWDYWTAYASLYAPVSDIRFSAALRELARAAGGYSLVAVHLGNQAVAVRAAGACIGIGIKMAGDWPVRDTPPPHGGQIIQTLVGIAIEAIGYKTLQTVYEQAGDTTTAQATAAEYEALRQKTTAYAAAIAQAGSTQPEYVYDNY